MGDFVEMNTRKQERGNETISLVCRKSKLDIVKDGSGGNPCIPFFLCSCTSILKADKSKYDPAHGAAPDNLAR